MTVIEKQIPNPKAVKIKSSTSVGFFSELAYVMLVCVISALIGHWISAQTRIP